MGLWNRIKFLFNFLFSFDVKDYDWVDSSVIAELVSERKGINMYIQEDSKYAIPSFEDMFKIITLDGVKWSKYIKERFDCDNFSMAFAGNVSWFYGINNVGIAIGNVYDTNGNLLFRHSWNVFVVKKKDGNLYMYMYEPQSGLFTSYKSGRILDKVYVPDVVII